MVQKDTAAKNEIALSKEAEGEVKEVAFKAESPAGIKEQGLNQLVAKVRARLRSTSPLKRKGVFKQVQRLYGNAFLKQVMEQCALEAFEKEGSSSEAVINKREEKNHSDSVRRCVCENLSTEGSTQVSLSIKGLQDNKRVAKKATSVQKAASKIYALHFYPKLVQWAGRTEQTGVMIIQQGSKKIGALYARGGPESKVGTAGPTPKGARSVNYIGPKQGSGRWPMSIVRWGARLETVTNAKGQVTAVYEVYTDASGKERREKLPDWKLRLVNTKDFGSNVGLVFNDSNQDAKISPDEMTVENMALADKVKGGQSIYSNDFGHMCADLGSGIFIHPTSPMYDETTGQPRSEYSDLGGQGALQSSHGCVHMSPAAIDYLISNGYLTKQSQVVVHGYTENPPAEAQGLLSQTTGP